MTGNWKEFERRQHGPSDAGYLSLNDQGEFFMNELLFEQFGRPEVVTLHFDTDNNRIGIRKTEARRVNALRVCRRKGSWVVRSRAFMREWNIQLNGTYCFPDLHFDEDMLILPLDTRFNSSLKRRR